MSLLQIIDYSLLMIKVLQVEAAGIMNNGSVVRNVPKEISHSELTFHDQKAPIFEMRSGNTSPYYYLLIP